MATAPGINHWIPLPYGAFGSFLRDPLGSQLRARERFGDVFRLRIGPLLTHFLFHPDHVRHVLYDHPRNYLRGWHYRLLRSLAGDNLVVSEGEPWIRQRRLAQPAFHRQRLAGYVDVMADATGRMLARWRGITDALDVGREMSRLALEIAGRTLFGRDTGDEADAVGANFAVVAEYLDLRLNHPLTTLPAWVPTPANLRFKRAVRSLSDIVLALVRERRREGRDHGDLLSMLIQARDEETGSGMTDDELRSAALAFFIAGHETSATALAWTWYLLARHPAARERARREAIDVFGERVPTFADVARLDYGRMVVEEALRLYPPVWVLPRQAVHDDEVGGYRIPAGSTVALSMFVTHRHPDAWEDPDAFDPERFAPERVARRPKGAYFPFLGGPHQCIGNEFAMLEMRLIVAMVLREFDPELLPGQDIRPKASITLRPSGPVRITLRGVNGRGSHGAGA